MQHIAVFDIGKTNVKLALVDLDRMAETDVETQPNVVLAGPPWPHFDTDAQWAFLIGALHRMGRHTPIEGIVVATHGACGALLDRDGALAVPVLDYEHDGPDETRRAYDRLRPPFAETGSPPLPLGLNLGAQLFWQLDRDPGLIDRVRHVVTWPQYWGHRLTGQLACDVCSLGAHTDLWAPGAATWSALPGRLGLGDRMAPARLPGEVLGKLAPEVAARTGLGEIPVLCGIHDSNASLIPHLVGRAPPFSVVSTGTWVISMAIGGQDIALDPSRDTLLNVNALGRGVPSARFMGGREYDMIIGRVAPGASPGDAAGVLARQVMLLPSVVPDCGPFQGQGHAWTIAPQTDRDLEIALGYYLGLMTAECLTAIGAMGPTLVEGPFVANPWFLSMVATATGRPVVIRKSRTGTAVGAAMLFDTARRSTDTETAVAPDPRLTAYAEMWKARAHARGRVTTGIGGHP